MHLIYLDESGNTGMQLGDAIQPVFALGALIVPETKWLEIELQLTALTERFFPAPRPPEFELHASELINARGYFRQFPIAHRMDFIREAINVACRLKLTFI